MKKRSNQMQSLIIEADSYFRANNITNQDDSLFLILTNNLIHQDMYRGFCWQHKVPVTYFNSSTGVEETTYLWRCCNEDEAECLCIL